MPAARKREPTPECAERRGLPISNLTSQFLANVYLDALDHFVKHELRCKGYVRYMDEMIVILLLIILAG